MGTIGVSPVGSRKVHIADQHYVKKAFTPNVTDTSQDLEAILGEAIPENVSGVLINNIGSVDLKYQTDGTDASAVLGGTIPAGSFDGFAGDEAHLNLMQLFKVSSDAVSIKLIFSPRGE